MEKNNSQMSFSSYAIERRKIKSQFFDQINRLLDWQAIDKELTKYYTKGLSATGRASYPALVLFKMTLLQTWYGLSDYEVEDRVNDSISFMEFVGLTLEDTVPDHSVISRFRTALSQNNAYEYLLHLINEQLEQRNIVVKQGAIVDASITDSPRKPRGKKSYQIAEDLFEEKAEDLKSVEDKPITPPINLAVQKHVDIEAGWIKKGNKLRYGYKKHVCTDEEGFILGIVTTPANKSDINQLSNVLSQSNLPQGIRIKADKGYSSQENRAALKASKLKDGIMHKAQKNKPITKWEQTKNKLISQTRFKIERTFGSIKRWFNAGFCRYVGQTKTHGQHLLEAIAYNLYRAPGIVFKNINFTLNP